MKKTNVENVFINISRVLLLFVGADVLLTSILLVCGISVSKANLLIASLLAIAVFVRINDGNYKTKTLCIIGAFTLFTVVVLANSFVNELAYDGNLYHKFATGILKLGYNPIYDRVEDYLNILNIPVESWYSDDVWVECYPKASWFFDSTIYVWTDWIESAKAFNWIVMLTCLGICYDYFRDKLSRRYALIITAILSITPTSISMLFSFYLDGALGQLLLMTIVILMSITDEDYTGCKRNQFVYLFICITLCGNLKVSGLGFEAIFCFAFFVWWIIRLYKTNADNIAGKIFKLIIFYTLTVLITVFIVGAGTYIMNIIRYGNVMYPMGAMEGFDIANNLKPVGLERAKPLVQILCMIFVRTTTVDTIDYLEWKIPFTFDFEQLKHSTYDVIRGGTGIFYSGILLISVVLAIYLCKKCSKYKCFDQKAISLVVLISIVLLCVIPAGGQTRYSPYIFYPVSFTIYYWMLETEKGHIDNKIVKVVPLVMAILIGCNTLPFINYFARSLQETPKEEAAYNEMVENGVYINTKLPGLVFNLIDRNISYEYDVDRKFENKLKYLEFQYELKE